MSFSKNFLYNKISTFSSNLAFKIFSRISTFLHVYFIFIMFFKQGLNFFSLSISFFKISNTFWLTMGCPMILNKMPTRWTWGLCRWVLNQCLCQCRDGPCLLFAQKREVRVIREEMGLQRNEIGYYHKSYIHIISLVLLCVQWQILPRYYNSRFLHFRIL